MIDLTAHRRGEANQIILEEIAAFIGRYKREHILRVAVDGVDGVGKTTFADKLGTAVERITPMSLTGPTRKHRPPARASADRGEPDMPGRGSARQPIGRHVEVASAGT
jgi:hypothetical protein